MHLVVLKNAFYKCAKYICYDYRTGWFIGPRSKAHGFYSIEDAMTMVNKGSYYGDWTFNRLEEIE